MERCWVIERPVIKNNFGLHRRPFDGERRASRLTIFGILLLMYTFPSNAQSRSHGRSMTITTTGIVSSSQTLASVAGAQMLARGGSAVDAAITTNAVLSVTEPMMNGIGGDLFAIYRDAKTGKLTGLNSSGWAPEKLTPQYLHDKGRFMVPTSGIHSVTVPGAVEGWAKMHKRFGRLPWRELFQPAIYYAEKGFPVSETIQLQWTDPISDEARSHFLPGGKAPSVGQIFKNPALAKAYKLIAEQGRSAVYTGAIAKAILATSTRLEGTMQASDLSEFQAEWVDPISTTYRGWAVHEMPPNGQGIAALQMLNVLEQLPVHPDFKSADALHTRIEAMKIAYADLTHVADPRVSSVPITGMLAKPYAAERAKLFDNDTAHCSVAAGAPERTSNTVYLAVVDKDGNMVSWIQSISGVWGSGVLVDGMGFVLQNRGANFDMDDERANLLAGRKRPRHTIIPAFMETGGRHIAFGIMGGMNQPMAHAQFVSNFVDYGMNLQAAMDAPRFTKQYLGGCDLLIESRFQPQVLEQLRKKGHVLTEVAEYGMSMGRGEAVMHDDATGVNFGASSGRGDGAAIPEPPRYAPAAAPAKRAPAKTQIRR
jgi:gamma-glutamyltranspeptidase/glutathione hydrolase